MPNVTLKNVRADGAVIDVAVGPSTSQTESLKRTGLPPILPVLIKALVDTGAKSIYVDLSVVDDLGLVATGDFYVNTLTTGAQPVVALTYDVELTLIGPPHVIASQNLRVVALDLTRFGVRLILGRDVLARCLLIYNGSADQFTFSF